jgi:hypothetical protein
LALQDAIRKATRICRVYYWNSAKLGQKHLLEAVERCNVEITRVILANGVDLNINARFSTRTTILQVTVSTSGVEVVKLLQHVDRMRARYLNQLPCAEIQRWSDCSSNGVLKALNCLLKAPHPMPTTQNSNLKRLSAEVTVK